MSDLANRLLQRLRQQPLTQEEKEAEIASRNVSDVTRLQEAEHQASDSLTNRLRQRLQNEPPQTREQAVGAVSSELSQEQGDTTAGGIFGGMTRGLTPVAAGAVAGIPFGPLGPPTGAASVLVTQLLTSIAQNAGMSVATPRDMSNAFSDMLGVEDPDTWIEQTAEEAAAAYGGTASSSAFAGFVLDKLRHTQPFLENIGTRFLDLLSSSPASQRVGAAAGEFGAEGGAQIAERNDMGAGGQTLLPMVGGLVADAGASTLRDMAQIPFRAAGFRNTQEMAPYGQRSPYTLSEERQAARISGERYPTQHEGMAQQRRDFSLRGTGELQQRRFNENQREIRRLMDQYNVEFDEFGNAVAYQLDEFFDPIRLVDEQGNTVPLARQLMDDFIETRGQRLADNLEQKNDVIRYMSRESDVMGPVPVDNAISYIDSEVEALSGRTTEVAQRLEIELEKWRVAIQNQDLEGLENVRKDLQAAIDGMDNASIRGLATRKLKEMYSHINEAMGDYIKNSPNGEQAFQQWRQANENLARLAGDYETQALTTVLEDFNRYADQMRPENMLELLFSRRPSDNQALYRSLSDEGREMAKQVLIAHFGSTTNVADMSPTYFAQSIRRHGDAIGIFFDDDEIEFLQGLKRHFDITQEAEAVARSSGGMQGPPTSALPGSGTALSMFVRQRPEIGLAASALSVAGLGFWGRVRQQSPHIKRMYRELASLEPGSIQEQNLYRLITRALVREAEEFGAPTEDQSLRNVPSTMPGTAGR